MLLSRHHRKASINGALTPSWEILCSVFQGCPLAPTLYAIAAESEGRRQVVDVKVTGLRTPCGRELLAVMFADDTQNLVTMATLHSMLNNNTLWCLASGGGTQEIRKQGQQRTDCAWLHGASPGETLRRLIWQVSVAGAGRAGG